ncbi:hypothetical protein MAR_003870 [Mya arenaria]|uniref:Uncharacterized protein n=1 Tax=Mya arenaria TaxID=6604 RepID=A0ABY7EWU6_MYAAR|nr:hypothetical protein MAR_003870 [Mya arenaria]
MDFDFTRKTMNPNKAPPMNRPVPAPRTVLPKRESPSRGTSAMATNENPVDSPACRDFSSKLKLFDQQSKGESECKPL